MRLVLLAGAIVILVGAGLTALSIGGGSLDPVGDVAGAVESQPAPASPAPSDGAVAHATPTLRPTPTPVPTPTPDPTPAPVETLTGYVSPLPRGRLTLPFGPSPWGSRIVDGEPFHDGMDLATFCGDRIVAAHAGTVLAAGRKYDQHMGWVGDLQPYLDRLEAKGLWMTLPIVVVIDDGNGYRSIYAHFSKAAVKRGDVVEAGDLIGYEGQTGRASGCHLHYGLFSPLETTTFRIDPDVVKRMKVPDLQVARIDPLLVLPMHAPKPKPTPTASASPTTAGSPAPSP
jgi:murein DD-endopeptidase MepM/ murein hydrolase activator NlpD